MAGAATCHHRPRGCREVFFYKKLFITTPSHQQETPRRRIVRRAKSQRGDKIDRKDAEAETDRQMQSKGGEAFLGEGPQQAGNHLLG